MTSFAGHIRPARTPHKIAPARMSCNSTPSQAQPPYPMEMTFLDVYNSIREILCARFPELDPAEIVFSSPPSLALGDVAVPMFPLAKKQKAAPQTIAKEAASIDFGELVAGASAAGPYLNLKLDRNRVGADIIAHVLAAGNRWGSDGSGAGKRVLIEHTSINPNADPHVGRGRCAMIGDSITRLLRFLEFEVEVHYYVNDMGRQIGLLALAVDDPGNLSFDQVLNAYVQANQRAETDPEFAGRGYDLLAGMEAGDPEVREKFHAVTDLCLKGQLAVLKRLGATYDYFDHESAYVNDPRLERIESALRKKDALFTDEENRLVVDLARLGHAQDEGRFFVLRRANGSSMYGCRDLVYSIDKQERGADINLMVLGEDHKLYAQQIAMILEAAGIPAPETIYYAYILLKDGKMSTRQGKVVLLADFLDQAAALALERVSEQFPGLSAPERDVIAEQVAVGAIRFAVLRVKPNKNVMFDMEAALSFQGDTGPYIQYSCARIRSILRKWGRPVPETPTPAFSAQEDAEWALLLKLAAFPGIVRDAAAQRLCAPIAVYALELARAFTSFYHDCPVLAADNPALTRSRLLTCRSTLQTLENAMHILGMEVPERM